MTIVNQTLYCVLHNAIFSAGCRSPFTKLLKTFGTTLTLAVTQQLQTACLMTVKCIRQLIGRNMTVHLPIGIAKIEAYVVRVQKGVCALPVTS